MMGELLRDGVGKLKDRTSCPTLWQCLAIWKSLHSLLPLARLLLLWDLPVLWCAVGSARCP